MPTKTDVATAQMEAVEPGPEANGETPESPVSPLSPQSTDPEARPTYAWLDDPRVRKAANTVAVIFAFYWVLQKLWPAPAGVILKGAVIGGLYALIALGIALIYRANRIINFAQGDLGGGPAALAVLLIVS